VWLQAYALFLGQVLLTGTPVLFEAVTRTLAQAGVSAPAR